MVSKRQCAHPISSFVSYNHLSSSFCSFIASLDFISLPNIVHEALSYPGWCSAMMEEMQALDDNSTWDLVPLPTGKKAIGRCWVFAVKFNLDGFFARLKAHLVAKGYAQTYGVDYSDTFSPVAKLTSDGSVTRLKVHFVAKGYAQTYEIDYSDTFSFVAKLTSVRLFISLVASYKWDLHLLDFMNAFLHGDLQKEVYMEQPPGFVVQGEIEKVCRLRKSLYGLKQSPRAWFDKFSQTVEAFNMQKSKSDTLPCIKILVLYW